jgi:hypothetical protein
LPAPTQFLRDLEEDDDDFTNAILNEKSNATEVYVDKIPPYGHRNGWVPRTVEVNFIYK